VNTYVANATGFPTLPFPIFQNFESGSGGWVASGITSTWGFGTPAGAVLTSAFSGVNSWVVSGGLTGPLYPNDEDSFLTSPIFDFTSLVNDPYVSVRITYDIEGGFDGARLEVITTNAPWGPVGVFGAGWYSRSSVIALGRVPGWSGENSPWALASTQLVGVAGKFAQVRFHFASDDTQNNEGFAFDDFAIQATPNWVPLPPTSQAPTSQPPVPTTQASRPATSQAQATSRPIPASSTRPRVSSAPIQNDISGGSSNAGITAGGIAAAVIIPIVVVAAIIAVVVYLLVVRRKSTNTKVKLSAAEHELSQMDRKRQDV
jgi:hypothetical protein